MGRAFDYDQSIAIMSPSQRCKHPLPGSGSYDFVHCRTDDGKAFRTLSIIDEYSRECLAIRVDRKRNSGNVIDVLSDLFILRGVPSFIRSDNGLEFVAQAVQEWIKAPSQQIAPQSPAGQWSAQ